MSKIRIGILGTSNIAKKAIIPNLLALPTMFDLVGIASRDKSKLNTYIHDLNTKAFQGYDAIISKELIDALYIPLPNALHFEYVQKALNNGLHVLVEKSLACSFQEVSKLVSLAQAKNLVLMENFQFRFHSQLTFLLEQLQSEKLGAIREVRAFFGFPPFPDVDNIRYKKALGGGALLDAGAYTTKIAQIILGSDLQVEAASLNSINQEGVDIWGTAYLKQKETGITAALAFGFDHYYQCGIEIWCSKGRLFTNRLFTAPANYKPVFEIETNQNKQVVELDADNHFEKMLTYFYQCTESVELRNIENKQNLDQARLLESIKMKA
jgi:predicted dehydrogenase